MPQIAGFRGALTQAPKAKADLQRDPTRALYRYAQSFTQGGRTVTRSMLVAAVRLAPWTDGSIRPHEAVAPAARDASLARMVELGAHTEAVLAGYRDAARETDRVLRGVEDGKPAIEATTADGCTHRVWRIPSAEVIGKLRTLFAPKKLHVLDGHARYEAMLAYAGTLGADAQPQYSSVKYGLGCLVNLEDPSLVVAACHRVVRGEGVQRDAILDAARQFFIVEKLAGAAAKDVAKQQAALADTVAHQPAFVAVFAGDGDAWKLTLKPDTSPVFEGVQVHRALQKYDPIVVEHLFLGRLAPGSVVAVEREVAAVHAAVGAGAQMGLVMRPLDLAQVIHADELGALLPAGSTQFPPPSLSLVSFVIDPDEDLV